jgi:prophage regulatory protein
MDIKPMDLNSPDQSHSRRMLRLQQVIEKTGLGKTTIYQMQKSASFPHSVLMTSRSVRWIEAEIDAWVAQRTNLRISQKT